MDVTRRGVVLGAIAAMFAPRLPQIAGPAETFSCFDGPIESLSGSTVSSGIETPLTLDALFEMIDGLRRVPAVPQILLPLVRREPIRLVR